MATTLGLEVTLDMDFDAAIERVTAALQGEGFGVLTRIDLHDAFKNKLGVEFRRYAILGACNPKLAHRAVTSTPEIGLLLPCNVTVEEALSGAGATLVRIVDANQMMRTAGMEDDGVLPGVAREASERLQRVAHALADAT